MNYRISLIWIVASLLLVAGCSGIAIRSLGTTGKTFVHYTFEELNLEIIAKPADVVTIENIGKEPIEGAFVFRVGVEGITHNRWEVDVAPGEKMEFALPSIGTEYRLRLRPSGDAFGAAMVRVKRIGRGKRTDGKIKILDKATGSTPTSG